MLKRTEGSYTTMQRKKPKLVSVHQFCERWHMDLKSHFQKVNQMKPEQPCPHDKIAAIMSLNPLKVLMIQ